MVSMSRTRLILGLALVSLLSAVPCSLQAQGEKKAKGDGEFKRVTFKSFDGVELAGTFYPPAGTTKRDATVLFLHDFDAKGGGNSHQDGWDKLAERLQAQGYSVLSFDFRGFGESKTVDKDTFWSPKFKHNATMGIIRQHPKTPETIDYKDFTPAYYKYLVNDIAAAKAFLDRKNDAREVNSGNVILIGAGQGATLGSLWLASECRRCMDKAGPNPPLGLPPMGFNDPESQDIVCAIWLTVSPSLAGQNIGLAVRGWNQTAAREKKITVAFFHGALDTAGGKLASSWVTAINGNAKTKDENAFSKGIADSGATGSKLLSKTTKTDDIIVKGLNDIMTNKRDARTWVNRNVRASRYWFVIPPKSGFPLTNPVLAKPAGEDSPWVDVGLFYPR
jgi:pimeloyl-ACP methyl ester carboxylesterase